MFFFFAKRKRTKKKPWGHSENRKRIPAAFPDGAAAVDMSGTDFSALLESAGTMLTLSAQCLSSGQYGTIQLLDNGYLVTGISGSVQVFDIGEREAARIFEWIRENADVTSSTDDGELTVSQTVTAQTETAVSMPHCG